jgi:hypothetical protein
MIGHYPVVSFDTSAHNRLATADPMSEAVLAGLKSGLHFRFVGLSIEEIIATSHPLRRDALLASCARIQAGMSDCIYPHGELLRLMILEHSKNPAGFDWKRVDVKAREFEREIQTRKLIDDAISAEQRAHLKERQREYKAMYSNLQPKLAAILAKHGEAAPPTFQQAVARLKGEGKLITGMAQLLYDPIAKVDSSEATIREFMDVCPPFRGVIYAMLMSWYNLAMRDDKGERFEAGRNDLYMAVHLPYCDKFVTAETYREQEKCLREIVVVAGLDTEILSYDDFCNSFLIAV